MFRKTIIAIILCVALLFVLVTLVSAQEPGKPVYQMDMSTPTPIAVPVEPTPVGDLPLSGTTTQSGTCPMMSGSGMTGMDMGSMSGMNTGGMNMGGMGGMNMGGMSGMQGMTGMNMTGMSGSMTAYSTPWYNDPWLMLGWVLLVVLVAAILTGSVVGVQALIRRSKPVSSS